MKLDLTSFEKAVEQLQVSLDYYDSDLAKKDSGVAAQFRSACIQGFEYTYEISWKMLKRHLEMTSPNPQDFDKMSFPELIRSGNEKDLLLSDIEKWKMYREARDTTSHAYNEKKAVEVFEVISPFLEEAKFLLKKLKENS
jgi:nucleotidyltransferase substrate binding protein (TIGR01987 family)